MEVVNLLHYENRFELRQWLKENRNKESTICISTIYLLVTFVLRQTSLTMGKSTHFFRQQY